MLKNILISCSLIMLLLLNLSGCASVNHDFAASDDPYEKMNRKIFSFNMAMDKVIIRPVAKGYDFILPSPVKKGITNVLSNIDEIPNVINDILQAKPAYTLEDTWRFILNSTIGIVGLFDAATPLRLQKRHQDFGITLAKWGAKNTPYIVLPFFGPSTIRDAVALPLNFEFSVSSYLTSIEYRYMLEGISVVNKRSSLLFTDKLINESFDPYVFVRDAYLQRRAYLVEGNKHINNETINNDSEK